MPKTILILSNHYITIYAFRRELVARALLDPEAFNEGFEQLSLFSAPQVQQLAGQGVAPRLAGLQVKEEAVKCIARQM